MITMLWAILSINVTNDFSSWNTLKQVETGCGLKWFEISAPSASFSPEPMCPALCATAPIKLQARLPGSELLLVKTNPSRKAQSWKYNSSDCFVLIQKKGSKNLKKGTETVGKTTERKIETHLNKSQESLGQIWNSTRTSEEIYVFSVHWKMS